MRRLLWRAGMAGLTALAVLALNPLGCRSFVRSWSKLVTRHLVVYVPCNLMLPVKEIASLYERRNPRVKVKFFINHFFVLAGRLKSGYYADVCFFPGPVEMRVLGGLVEGGSWVKFGGSDLVVVTSPGLGKKVQSLSDLAKPCFKRIVLPDPEITSIGAFALSAMVREGVWEEIRERTRFSRLPLEALAKVVRGEAEAAVTSLSCPLKTMPSPSICPIHAQRIKVIRTGLYDVVRGLFPPGMGRRLWVGGAVMRGSKRKVLAREFLEFTLSGDAQRVLKRYGLSLLTGGSEG